MRSDNHIPEFKKRSFTCPYCKVTTQHQWHIFESINEVKRTIQFPFHVITEPFNSTIPSPKKVD